MTPRLMAAAICLAILAYAPSFFDDWQDREWITLFARSGQRLTAGETLYRFEDRDMYAYLPGLAVLTLPLAHLPPAASITFWYGISFSCVVFSVWSAWRLSVGQDVPLRGRWLIVLLATFLLGGRFLLSPLENHQFDSVICALVMGGLLACHRGRGVRGGALLGLGAALKGTPLLFAPYLVWRGQWKTAAVLVLAGLSLNLLPDLIGPRASGRSHLEDCYTAIVAPARSRPPGMWLVGSPMQHLNQSLGATVHRFANFGLALNRDERPISVSPAQARSTQRLINLLSVVLIGVTLWSGGEPGTRATTGRPCGILHGEARRSGVEAAIVMCLMLLFSPQSSKAHFVVLVLPVMVLVREALVENDRVLQAVLAILAVLGPLSAKGLIGSELGDRLLLWGAPTFFTLTVLAALWRVNRGLGAQRPNLTLRQTAVETPRHETGTGLLKTISRAA